MFRNNNATTLEAPTGLPSGYDDPASDMYVPEPLRPLYGVVTAPTFKDIRNVVAALATAEARPIVANRYVGAPAGVQYAAALDAEADRITEQDHERLHSLATHAIRLERAEKEHERRERRLADQTAVQAMHTCPICDEYDTVKNGFVQHRDLMAETSINRSGHRLRSCWSCFNEAQHQMREARARDIVTTGRTRAALITAHLSL